VVPAHRLIGEFVSMTVSMRRSLQTPPTVQQLLHRLGRRISELPGSGDLDFLAACGIATLTFGRFLDFELSKSWQRNRLALAAALMILFACYPQLPELASCSHYSPLQFS
jgi:hypothetical protein